ncbi:MAG: LicD family protein [Lachnospiraceae bacterium]|nr:LicD family protein [Lachnospiraceae bacterium]
MIFPHSFYEDEIRCDYLIPSMVKRTWAAQIQILADLDEACRKKGLEYFAEWGTLLGTVRHGGFIPWDDDMDVCMKRKDYEYLIANPSSLLPDNYSVVNYRSNRDFKQMLSRIVSSDHYRFDPEYMKKYSGLPIALGIDIFPLDFLTEDEEYEKDREERVRLVYDVVNEIAHFDTPLSRLSGELDKIEKRLAVKLDRKGDVLTQLRDLLVKMFGEVDEDDAAYITMYPLWLDNHAFRFPVHYYKKSIRMRFENTTIPVPACYEDVLRHKYGSSFMTPVRSGGAHEYPYFEEHINILREHFGYEWPTYRFNEGDVFAPREKAETFDGGTAVFITYSPEAFANMRKVVKQYVRKGYDVTILPVEKYDIAPDMSGITPADEEVPDEFYTDGIKGAKVIRNPRVLDMHPNDIVSDFPYDEYNLITTVDRKYYSKSLRGICDRLVYVPPFEAKSVREDDERAIKLMPQYVCTPMCMVCDEIVLGSSEMKERYTECLTRFSGERYKDVWEKKISVLTDSDDRKEVSHEEKKKILFYVGLATFAQHGVAAVEKIANAFEVFDTNSDKIDAVYLLQENLLDNLRGMFPELYEKYEACDFRPEADYVDTDMIDAYYGEASEFATEFVNKGKPVMIMAV